MLDPAQLKDPDVLRHTVLDFRQMSAFVQNPLILDRADGVHYWDIDGKHYYDGISGIFVVAVGHNNRRIIEAMQAQMERLCLLPPCMGPTREPSNSASCWPVWPPESSTRSNSSPAARKRPRRP